MIDKILHQAQQFTNIIAELKRESSYYPLVLIKYYERNERRKETEREKENTFIHKLAAWSLGEKSEEEIDKVCYASTLVRIERNGKWYTVHCVESIIHNELYDEKDLLLKVMDSVYKIQLLYQIEESIMNGNKPLQDIDNLQQSEVDRVTLLCARKT
jgi:hypothetical protein